MRAILVVLALLCAQSVSAKDDVPFPELSTEVYCLDLVSKMLDKGEQQVEKEKCLGDEAALKRKLKSLWHLALLESQQYLVAQYYKEERNQTYITAAHYTAQGVGLACMDGRLDCRFPPASADDLKTFPYLNSPAYCSATIVGGMGEKARQAKTKECLDNEEMLKRQLQPIWSVVDKKLVDFCMPLLFHIKQHSYKMLQMCVASRLGNACILGSVDCKFKS
ncbi:hypothetical protein [Aminobacter sp. AP02]|uniref:hypothetical protein n=1 Tax=Aminobacter sp. AP02 TaxID=2135737 RepID=UPI000D6AE582|nr:hypothetical protein [Aminobacter sp. AP02]PWK63705.1 hypothetical protein C8K44_12326 [Aminobacter sp. AP02]